MLDPHAALPFAATVDPLARPAQRLTWDSREASPEVAFVALPGEKMHGNRFVEAALAAGAPFVLTDLDVERGVRVPDAQAALFTWARQERAKNHLVVGITGSAGKTTAKSYVAAALDAHFMPVFNTPPAIACFLIQYGKGGKPLVVEMGIDRVGEMAELVDLVQPDVGVITTIGATHLEALGTVDNVAFEKGHILRDITGQPLRRSLGALVGAQAAAYFPETATYGFGEATFAGKDLHVTPEGATFTFAGQPVSLPHAATVQAEAAVLGLALAQGAGIPLHEAAGRMAAVQVPAGRYRVYPGRYTVIDDAYNASPIAVHAALEALSSFPGRRVSVLGRMLELGDTERALHAEVGQQARAKADVTYGVGAFASELGERAYRNVPELLAALLADTQDGDVILIKASRGISWTPEQRATEGVGLDTVVAALLEEQ